MTLASGEVAARDLRVEISRNGSIVDRRLYFNVPAASVGIPVDRSTFQDLEPTALYLALPAAGTEILPADAYVQLPSDGSPVPYDDLLNDPDHHGEAQQHADNVARQRIGPDFRAAYAKREDQEERRENGCVRHR